MSGNRYPVGVRVEDGDGGKQYVVVVVGPATFIIHESLVTPRAVNVEVDGNFAGRDGLRIHVNDRDVFDSHRNSPPRSPTPGTPAPTRPPAGPRW